MNIPYIPKHLLMQRRPKKNIQKSQIKEKLDWAESHLLLMRNHAIFSANENFLALFTVIESRNALVVKTPKQRKC